MDLATYLSDRRITQSKFAGSLSPPVTQTLVSQWVNGKTRVPLARALEIRSITRGLVTPDDLAAMYRQTAVSARPPPAPINGAAQGADHG